MSLAFVCELRVAPFARTPGISAEGGNRWVWPGPAEGPFTTECRYRCDTEAQLLVHLIVTHRLPMVRARAMVAAEGAA